MRHDYLVKMNIVAEFGKEAKTRSKALAVIQERNSIRKGADSKSKNKILIFSYLKYANKVRV